MERIEFDNHWISLASYSLVHVTCLSKKMAITESGIVYYRSNDVRHLLFQSNLVNCRMNERICVVVHIKALSLFILKLCTSYIFCLLQVQVNFCQKLFFLQNMGRTCCVQKLFWMSETISVHNMFSPGLISEFSSIELVIQWTICGHIVG